MTADACSHGDAAPPRDRAAAPSPAKEAFTPDFSSPPGIPEFINAPAGPNPSPAALDCDVGLLMSVRVRSDQARAFRYSEPAMPACCTTLPQRTTSDFTKSRISSTLLASIGTRLSLTIC